MSSSLESQSVCRAREWDFSHFSFLSPAETCQNWTEIGSLKQLRRRKRILCSGKAALGAAVAFQWKWEVGKPRSQWIPTSPEELLGFEMPPGMLKSLEHPTSSNPKPPMRHFSPHYLCCLKSQRILKSSSLLPQRNLEFPTHRLPTLPKAKEWKVLHVTFLGKTLFPFSATALLKAR